MGARYWCFGPISLDNGDNWKRFKLTDGEPRHHVSEAWALDGQSDAYTGTKAGRRARHDRRRTLEMHELEWNIPALELVDDRKRRTAAGNAIGARQAGGDHVIR
jgi:hypothetical protein